MNLLSFRIAFVAGLLAASPTATVIVQAQEPSTATQTVAETSIPSQDLVQPSDLIQLLQSSEKPLVLQVGSHVLYAEAHIPGSKYVGAAGTSAGLQALRERVAVVKKDQTIVIYCGCCPWGRCPNIRPAYAQLHALGFTRVKALYLGNNFGSDWVDKGLPVAKGR